MNDADLVRLDGAHLWAVLHEAARGSRTGHAGTVARLCAGGGLSGTGVSNDSDPHKCSRRTVATRLGWVCPPSWNVVSESLSPIRAVLGTPPSRQVVLLGTGGWTFAARALCEVLDHDTPVVPMDSLDPSAIDAAVAARARPPGAYVAVSASGKTMETVRLAESVPALDGTERAPLVWLSDDAAPPRTFALSPRQVRDQVAILGAPLSTAFLLPAALMADSRLAPAYTTLRRRHHELAASAARQAVAVDVSGSPHLRLVAPQWAGDGLRMWLLQLGRQALCGKSRRFRPWFDVTGPGDEPRFDVTGSQDDGYGPIARFDLSHVEPGLTGLLELMYTAVIIVGCVALRAGVEVAEECNVHEYKDLLPDPIEFDEGGDRSTAHALPGVAADWLGRRPDLRRLHVVVYASDAELTPAVRSRFATATGRTCEVHEGSAWNHHSYQAVYADPSAAVLVVAPSSRPPADHPLAGVASAQCRLAVATHRSLADRSHLVRLDSEGG